MSQNISPKTWRRRTNRIIAALVIFIGLTMMSSNITQCIYAGMLFIILAIMWLAWLTVQERKAVPSRPFADAVSPVLFLVTSMPSSNRPTVARQGDKPPTYDQVFCLEGSPPGYYEVVNEKPNSSGFENGCSPISPPYSFTMSEEGCSSKNDSANAKATPDETPAKDSVTSEVPQANAATKSPKDCGRTSSLRNEFRRTIAKSRSRTLSGGSFYQAAFESLQSSLSGQPYQSITNESPIPPPPSPLTLHAATLERDVVETHRSSFGLRESLKTKSLDRSQSKNKNARQVDNLKVKTSKTDDLLTS